MNLYMHCNTMNNFCTVLILVFIYSMPGYNCSIKERMLYSSCKAPLLDLIHSLGVTIAKKVSIFNVLLIYSDYFILFSL